MVWVNKTIVEDSYSTGTGFFSYNLDFAMKYHSYRSATAAAKKLLTATRPVCVKLIDKCLWDEATEEEAKETLLLENHRDSLGKNALGVWEENGPEWT